MGGAFYLLFSESRVKDVSSVNIVKNNMNTTVVVASTLQSNVLVNGIGMPYTITPSQQYIFGVNVATYDFPDVSLNVTDDYNKLQTELAESINVTETPTAGYSWRSMKGFYSWYWPPLGGINCSNGNCGDDGVMANGQKWKDHLGDTVACPTEIEIGALIRFNNKVYVCRDRGGGIVEDNGIYWLDFLQPVRDSCCKWSQHIDFELYSTGY